MIYGIIGAMESEVDALKAHMENKKIVTAAGIDFCEGTLFGKDVIVVQCGIGKVNAALTTQNLINLFHPDLIINTGCAAGVGEGVQGGDIVMASGVVQHDLDYGDLSDARGFIDRLNLITVPADFNYTNKIKAIAESLGIRTHRGIIATGDQFLCDPVKKEDIKVHFNAYAVEMESGAIGHACYANGVPFVILRSISDNGDESAQVNFDEFVIEVNKLNHKILKEFLED